MSEMLQEIASNVSFDCAIRLAAAHGGSTIWVPSLESLSPACGLAALLGWKDAQALAEKYGGSSIHISGMDDFGRLRASSIAARLDDAGIGKSDIAQIIGTTPRRVSTLINEGRQYLPLLAIGTAIRGMKRLMAGPEGASIRSSAGKQSKENAK